MVWAVRTNTLLRSSLSRMASTSEVRVPVTMNRRFKTSVLRMTVGALVDLRKNSKFLNPHHSLPKTPSL